MCTSLGFASHIHHISQLKLLQALFLRGCCARLILESTSAAHVNEFAEHLPLGLDTPAGERGQALSGGQKQRVCIARALARKPRMLVFDEATSALDLRSERLVHKALKEVLSAGDCTCLVITHRNLDSAFELAVLAFPKSPFVADMSD